MFLYMFPLRALLAHTMLTGSRRKRGMNSQKQEKHPVVVKKTV